MTPSGKIVAARTIKPSDTEIDFALIRDQLGGLLNPEFGSGDGEFSDGISVADAVMVGPNRKIVVAGLRTTW